MPFRRRRRGGRRGSSRTVPSRKGWGGFDVRDPITGYPAPGTLDNNEQSVSWLASDVDCYDFYDEPTIARIIFRLTGYVRAVVGQDNSLTWFNEIRAGMFVTGPDLADPNSPAAWDLLNPSLEWVWYQTFQFYHFGGDVLSIINLNAQSGPYQGAWDLRTKRKIPEGKGLAWGIYNVDESGADVDLLRAFAWAVDGRILFLDH